MATGAMFVLRRLAGLVIISAGLCLAAAAGEGPGVSASVDRRSIYIGDRARYVICVRTDAGTEIEFPNFKDDRIGDFEIRASGVKVEKGLFGGRAVSGWYDITCFSAGKHAIPQTEIRYRAKGAREWTTKQVRTIDIAVESILAAFPASDIKDIKGPINFFDGTLLAVLSTLILSGAGMIAYIIYKIARKAPGRKLPYEIAMDELEMVRGAFPGTGDVKAYYVSISDCVRRYIENAFNLKAPEMTTEEFLGSLKDSASLSSAHKNLLKEFLGACDLVKFAKYAPNRIETESIFTTAEVFVQETKDVFADGAERTKP